MHRPSISIFINYFAPAKIIDSALLKPIQVGAATSPHNLDMLQDNSGNNISHLNPAYCEMTGIYWAWKNDLDADYLGFMQYRRFFDFRPTHKRDVNIHGLVNHPHVDSNLIERFGLDDDNIQEIVQDYDAIAPEPFDVRSVGATSLRDHYAQAPHHHIEDLDLAGRIIAKHAPVYHSAYEQAMSEPWLYPTNMFIFSRPLFNKYCDWVFPILDRLHQTINTDAYNWQEARAVGFIAERLFTVFMLAERATNPSLRLLELRRVFIRNTAPDPVEPPLPDTTKPIMTMVASSDSAYTPHLGALLFSVLDTTNPDYFIDFIVLDGGLSDGQRRLLRRIIKGHRHISLSFVDMSAQYLDLPLNSYFARATFYRLIIPDLLKSRTRVLFLDTDMVVIDDLAQLYITELDGALVGAAPDLVMRAFCNMSVLSLDTTGSLPARDYIAKHLGMVRDGVAAVNEYFQAGTMLMDLERLRKTGALKEAAADLSRNQYWFLDQDILNKYLFGRVKMINPRWNVLWMDDRHSSALSEEDRLSFASQFNAPGVAHFAGTHKPWLDGVNPLTHYYWQYLRATPWYETMLFSYLDKRFEAPLNVAALTQAPSIADRRSGRLRAVASSMWRRLPLPAKRQLAPLASRLKRILK